MSKEVEELQMNEFSDVKVLVDEEKLQEKSTDKNRLFGQLLEYFWKQDEEHHTETDGSLSDTAV